MRTLGNRKQNNVHPTVTRYSADSGVVGQLRVNPQNKKSKRGLLKGKVQD